MSTPLPPAIRSVPRSDDQYQFVIGSGINAGSEGQIATLGSFVNTKTILTSGNKQITFTMFALSGGETIDALCGTTPTFAFVDGLTMLAAQAKGCAQPVLQIQRGGANGYRVELLVSNQLNVRNVTDLRNQVYCRIEGQDVSSWFLPAILIRTTGQFDPITGFKSVRFVPDLQSLLSEIGYARCVGAAEADKWEKVEVPGFAAISRAITAIPGTSMPAFPYGGLVATTTIPDNVIDQFKTMLLDNTDELHPVIDFDRLVEADSATFSAATDFLRRAGVDLGRE